MGWLPLLLAISAFFGLLILVNINSIRQMEQGIGYAVFQFCQTARLRHTLLKNLPDSSLNRPCPEITDDWQVSRQNIAELNKCIHQERLSMHQSQLIAKHLPQHSSSLFHSLELLNHRQLVNIRMLERKVREYNRLLDQQPTKVVAQLFNFRPIVLSRQSSP